MRALIRGGFSLSHVRGSHHYMRRPDGKGLVVVPVHAAQTIPTGTMRSILRQAGLEAEDLVKLL